MMTLLCCAAIRGNHPISRGVISTACCILYSIILSAMEVETKYWDIAADIAVENVILEMDLHFLKIHKDTERKAEGAALKAKCGALTAEKIYRYLAKEKPDDEKLADMKLLFHRDEHMYSGRRSARGSRRI